MGYLPHTGGLSKTPHLIVVDAVLTELGRFRLAEGAGSFNITKFALGDDEIDYSLYDTTQATENQDDVIMLTPVLEAVPDSTTGIRHFLYSSQAPGVVEAPLAEMDVTPTDIRIVKGSSGRITVTTINAQDPDTKYSVFFIDNNANKALTVTGENVLTTGVGVPIRGGRIESAKIVTIGAGQGGNNATVVIRAENLISDPNDGGPIDPTDEFTYTLRITGLTSGLSKSVNVTWDNVIGGGGG